jgi:hypothetical protein
MMVLKHFFKKYMNVIHGIYEGIFMVAILMVCLIYSKDSKFDYSSNSRTIFEWIIVIMWMFIGLMNIGAVIFDFVKFKKLK